MPNLQIDQFDETPKVGDKVKVLGKVKSIDEDTGDVEVSYDDVSIVNASKHKKNKPDYTNPDTMPMDQQMNPNSQTLDQALAQSFPNTQ